MLPTDDPDAPVLAGPVKMSWMRHLVTGICWGLVVVIWIVGAVVGLQRGPARRRPSWHGAPWPIGVVAGIVVVYVAVTRNHPNRIVVHSWWVEIPGLVLLIAATVFTIWARLALGSMWSMSPDVLQQHHELRTDGPYAVTRHPIYTGLLGMLLGTMLLNGFGVAVVAFLAGVVVFGTRVPIEEKLMRETFPGDYERYAQRVPRLMPGLNRFRDPAARTD